MKHYEKAKSVFGVAVDILQEVQSDSTEEILSLIDRMIEEEEVSEFQMMKLIVIELSNLTKALNELTIIPKAMVKTIELNGALKE